MIINKVEERKPAAIPQPLWTTPPPATRWDDLCAATGADEQLKPDPEYGFEDWLAEKIAESAAEESSYHMEDCVHYLSDEPNPSCGHWDIADGETILDGHQAADEVEEADPGCMWSTLKEIARGRTHPGDLVTPEQARVLYPHREEIVKEIDNILHVPGYAEAFIMLNIAPETEWEEWMEQRDPIQVIHEIARGRIMPGDTCTPEQAQEVILSVDSISSSDLEALARKALGWTDEESDPDWLKQADADFTLIANNSNEAEMEEADPISILQEIARGRVAKWDTCTPEQARKALSDLQPYIDELTSLDNGSSRYSTLSTDIVLFASEALGWTERPELTAEEWIRKQTAEELVPGQKYDIWESDGSFLWAPRTEEAEKCLSRNSSKLAADEVVPDDLVALKTAHQIINEWNAAIEESEK
jgi:hypothetical protein